MPPAIAAIGTDAEPPEGRDVGVEVPLVNTVRVTTSTRTTGVGSNDGRGDMRGEGRTRENVGRAETKGGKSTRLRGH